MRAFTEDLAQKIGKIMHIYKKNYFGGSSIKYANTTLICHETVTRPPGVGSFVFACVKYQFQISKFAKIAKDGPDQGGLYSIYHNNTTLTL